MVKKTIILLVTGLSVSAFAGGFSALKLGADARSSGMGMAATALPDAGTGGYWNPAAVTAESGKQFSLSLFQWFEDVQSEFLGFTGHHEAGGFGGYIHYTQVGSIDYRTGATPEPVGTFSAYEMICGLTYSRELLPGLSVGVAGKIYYEKIFVDDSWGFGGDIGLLYRINPDGLRIGGVVQNVGYAQELLYENIALPLTFKAGVSCPVQTAFGFFHLALDGVKELDFDPHLHGGIQYAWENRFFIRLGYQSGYEIKSLSGGLGLLLGRYGLDYAYIPYQAGFKDTHRFSIYFVF